MTGNDMNDNDKRPANGDEPVPSWLTPEEEAVWRLEGFDRLPPTVSVPVAARFLGLGRSTGYSCVRDGTIGAVRFRRRLVVPRYELFKALFRFRPPGPADA